MTKENFNKLLETIEAHSAFITNIYKDYGIDFTNSPLIDIESQVEKCLKAHFNDESDWIGYWMWDLDFGKKWKEGMVADEYGKDIPLKTSDDLWNLLNK